MMKIARGFIMEASCQFNSCCITKVCFFYCYVEYLIQSSFLPISLFLLNPYFHLFRTPKRQRRSPLPRSQTTIPQLQRRYPTSAPLQNKIPPSKPPTPSLSRFVPLSSFTQHTSRTLFNPIPLLSKPVYPLGTKLIY